MNELGPFETELRELKPVKPPAEFMSRLSEVLADMAPATKPPAVLPARRLAWPSLFRWLAPAMALGMVLVSLNWHVGSPTKNGVPLPSPAVTSTLKADHVEIDRNLIGDFDAVARMPGGEPVRFRCREWADEVVLHDSTLGITIERRMPRLEVIPVSLETY
jgi:hypothetical protein